MRGQPQVPKTGASLDADVYQAVCGLRDALRAERDAQNKYDNELRSPGRRETYVQQLRRVLDKAIGKMADARDTLDVVLLGEDDE